MMELAFSQQVYQKELRINFTFMREALRIDFLNPKQLSHRNPVYHYYCDGYSDQEFEWQHPNQKATQPSSCSIIYS